MRCRNDEQMSAKLEKTEPNLFVRSNGTTLGLNVSEQDMQGFNNAAGGRKRKTWTTVTDRLTGKLYQVRPAACGAACYCAVEAKADRPDKSYTDEIPDTGKKAEVTGDLR